MASLNIPNAFTNNTVADATQVNQNFDEIETHVNTNLVNIDGSVKAGTSSIADGAVTVGKLASSAAEYLVPVGSIVSYIGATAPSGWLICDGTTFNATTYPALNTLLGGNTLPNLQLRIPMGAGAGANVKTSGGDRKILTTHLPVHSHSAGTLGANTNGSHSHSGTTNPNGDHQHATTSTGYVPGSVTRWGPSGSSANWTYDVTTGTAGNHSHSFGTSTEGSHGHSISGTTGETGSATDYFQPYYAVNYIIKAA